MNQNQLWGEYLNEIRGTKIWEILQEIKDSIVQDLNNGLFMDATKDISVFAEPQMGQIIAHRKGMIEGIEKLFKLFEMLNQSFLKSKHDTK